MPVTPEVQNVLDFIAAAEGPLRDEPDVAELRQGYAALGAIESRPEMASVTDHVVTGPGGDVPVRVYVPTDEPGPRPVLVYFHGGGWVIGSVETHDGTVRAVAEASGATVVSVDYRLAPENPFPAAIDDALAAIRWVVANAAELDVDPSRLAVGGDSAGGNLAAVAALEMAAAADGSAPR
ncbi:MAG TPA: alpha/beta hydrolase, partial [Acidimicrobiales bacterium]|nr:alpha/beta hydrolase [Acidimicrobiales bacterium]